MPSQKMKRGIRMEDKEFEEEMKQADETRKKDKLLKELDFDDPKRLLIEINDKLGSIKARLGFIVVAVALSFLASVIALCWGV